MFRVSQLQLGLPDMGLFFPGHFWGYRRSWGFRVEVEIQLKMLAVGWAIEKNITKLLVRYFVF